MDFWSSSNDSTKGSCSWLSVSHLCLPHLFLPSPCRRTKRGRGKRIQFTAILHLRTHTHTQTHTQTRTPPPPPPPHFHPHLTRTCPQTVPSPNFTTSSMNDIRQMGRKKEKVPISSFTKHHLNQLFGDTVSKEPEGRQS